jgi:hypothetical protein
VSPGSGRRWSVVLGDSGGRRSLCFSGLFQAFAGPAPALQSAFNVFGLKMRGHFSLPGQVSTKRRRGLGGKPFELYQRCSRMQLKRSPIASGFITSLIAIGFAQ